MKEIKHVGFGVNGFQLRNPFDGRAAILEPAGWLHENPKFGKEITFDKDVAGLEEHRGWVKTPLYDDNFTRHPAAPDAIEYIAAHYDALLEALEYIRARKEEARAAYLTDDAGNWQAEIDALDAIRSGGPRL